MPSTSRTYHRMVLVPKVKRPRRIQLMQTQGHSLGLREPPQGLLELYLSSLVGSPHLPAPSKPSQFQDERPI